MTATVNEKKGQVDEELAALSNNVSAVLAVAASVERTLGPKGLDTMLVDAYGDVLVTNSGVTILERMDASHPAARMLVQVAKTQHEAVGDGTTTATVMAAAILKEGMNQISRGVPVSRVLEGIEKATRDAVRVFREVIAGQVEGLDEPVLLEVAAIAGRGDRSLAELVVNAGKTIGTARLRNPAFKMADTILARPGVEDELFSGVVIPKGRLSPLMPSFVENAVILVVEDGLLPEEVEGEALHTESGFRRSLELKTKFFEALQHIMALGVNVILVEGGVHAEAEEILTHSGIVAVRRVGGRELHEIMAHTGAKPLKRSGLSRPADLLKQALGRARRVFENERTELTLVEGGGGEPRATLLVGASTREVAQERERKARDAASAFQAALNHGVVPGGGASELACARLLEERRREFKAMTSYGLDCVLEGLKRPFMQMAANAGFNPLEKTEEILNAQGAQRKNTLSIDFETGQLADMAAQRVYDPLAVKIRALKSASEVAQAILRINRIIKMRENGGRQA